MRLCPVEHGWGSQDLPVKWVPPNLAGPIPVAQIIRGSITRAQVALAVLNSEVPVDHREILQTLEYLVLVLEVQDQQDQVAFPVGHQEVALVADRVAADASLIKVLRPPFGGLFIFV
jgi:hypothetical protein